MDVNYQEEPSPTAQVGRNKFIKKKREKRPLRWSAMKREGRVEGAYFGPWNGLVRPWAADGYSSVPVRAATWLNPFESFQLFLPFFF